MEWELVVKALKDLDPVFSLIAYVAVTLAFLYSNFATTKFAEKVEAKLDAHILKSSADFEDLKWEMRAGLAPGISQLQKARSRRPAQSQQ